MAIIHNDTEFGDYTPGEYAATRGKITPLADADVIYIRKAHDAVVEVPHSFDPLDRLVMRWCAWLSVIVVITLLVERFAL